MNEYYICTALCVPTLFCLATSTNITKYVYQYNEYLKFINIVKISISISLFNKWEFYFMETRRDGFSWSDNINFQHTFIKFLFAFFKFNLAHLIIELYNVTDFNYDFSIGGRSNIVFWYCYWHGISAECVRYFYLGDSYIWCFPIFLAMYYHKYLYQLNKIYLMISSNIVP